MNSPFIYYLEHIQKINYFYNSLFDSIIQDNRYNLYIYDKFEETLEDEKQNIIISIHQSLYKLILFIEDEVERYFPDPIYYETSELIHKFYDKLKKVSRLVFIWYYRGQLYCPENFYKYKKNI